MKLSVLIPVYNERATLEEIVGHVQASPINKEIIIVDNCSTDGTRQLLEEWLAAGKAGPAQSRLKLRVVFQHQNQGKGGSVRKALALARGEWVIIQDADLEYDPADFLPLFEKVKKDNLDAVFGTRLLPGSEVRQNQPKTAFYFGRLGLSWLFNVLYKVPLSDVATCYKLMKHEVALQLDLQSNGFDLDFEIAAKLALGTRRQSPPPWKIGEIPISYKPRTELEGKKIHPLRDGWRAVRALLKYRLS